MKNNTREERKELIKILKNKGYSMDTLEQTYFIPMMAKNEQKIIEELTELAKTTSSERDYLFGWQKIVQEQVELD